MGGGDGWSHVNCGIIGYAYTVRMWGKRQPLFKKQG